MTETQTLRDTIWVISVHNRVGRGHSGPDRFCATLDVGKALCDDYLACLSLPRAIVEDWQDIAAHGDGLVWVRYFNDETDPDKEPQICEQRVEARRIDDTGRWFR